MSEPEPAKKNETQLVYIGPKAVEIPKEWEVTTIDSLNVDEKPICYGVLKPGADVEDGIPLIKIEDLEGNRIASISSVHHITEELHQEFSRSRLSGGEVLISVQGTIGRVAIVPDDISEANISRTVARITPNERANPVWLKNFLLSNEARSFMEIVSSGTTRSSLNIGTLRDIKALVPPLPEQRRIADILSKVDEQIQQTDEIIEKTAELKRGLMQDIVTGGIGHTSYKETLLGPKEVKIPESWTVELMEDVAGIVSGGTPKKSTEEYWGGDIVWVTPTDVTAIDGMYISDSAEKITEKGLSDSSAHLLEPGAVLMTSRATIGEAVINTVPATTNQGFKSLVPGERLHNEYLYYYVHTIADYLTEIGGGSTFPEINKSDTQNIRVPIPPLDEQKRIAEILNQADEKRLEERERKQKLQELKRGLMQDLLTGKVRVTPEN